MSATSIPHRSIFLWCIKNFWQHLTLFVILPLTKILKFELWGISTWLAKVLISSLKRGGGGKKLFNHTRTVKSLHLLCWLQQNLWVLLFCIKCFEQRLHDDWIVAINSHETQVFWEVNAMRHYVPTFSPTECQWLFAFTLAMKINTLSLLIRHNCNRIFISKTIEIGKIKAVWSECGKFTIIWTTFPISNFILVEVQLAQDDAAFYNFFCLAVLHWLHISGSRL